MICGVLTGKYGSCNVRQHRYREGSTVDVPATGERQPDGKLPKYSKARPGDLQGRLSGNDPAADRRSKKEGIFCQGKVFFISREIVSLVPWVTLDSIVFICKVPARKDI